MDVKEQAQRIGELLSQHAEKVGIAVLVILAALGGWMYMQEDGFSAPPIEKGAPTSLPEQFSESDEFERVNAQLLTPPDSLSQRPDLQRALRWNPFVSRGEPSDTQVSDWVSQDLTRAREAFEAEDYDRARHLVEGVLSLRPGDDEAEALAAEIEQKLEEMEDEADAADAAMDGGMNPGDPSLNPGF